MAKQAETTAQKAHDAIDKAEHAAKEAKRRVHSAKKRAEYKARHAKERVEDAVEKSADWVRENPAKAVLGAAAVGWIAAKLFGRRK